jgi:hypothetical protein
MRASTSLQIWYYELALPICNSPLSYYGTTVILNNSNTPYIHIVSYISGILVAMRLIKKRSSSKASSVEK